MIRSKLALIATAVLVVGSLGAQSQPPAKHAAAPAPAAAAKDTTHKVAKKGTKTTAKHDSTAKHDTTHAAAPKKPVKK